MYTGPGRVYNNPAHEPPGRGARRALEALPPGTGDSVPWPFEGTGPRSKLAGGFSSGEIGTDPFCLSGGAPGIGGTFRFTFH